MQYALFVFTVEESPRNKQETVDDKCMNFGFCPSPTEHSCFNRRRDIYAYANVTNVFNTVFSLDNIRLNIFVSLFVVYFHERIPVVPGIDAIVTSGNSACAHFS